MDTRQASSTRTEPGTAWRAYLRYTIVAQLLTAVGFGFVSPLMPLFIQDLGGFSPREAALWAGVLTGLSGIIMVFAGPIWGALSDWFGYKRNALRASFGTFAVIALTGVVQNLPQLFVLRFLMGAVSGVSPALMGLVASLAPRSRLAFTVGGLYGAAYLGSAIAPLVGGVFVDWLGFRAAFFFSGGLIGLGGLLVLLKVKETFHPESGTRHDLLGLWRGVRELAAMPGVRGALLTLFLATLAPNLVYTVLPLFLTTIDPGGGATGVGVFFTLLGLGTAASAYSTGALGARLGLGRVFLLGCLGAALGAFGMMAVDSLVVALGLGVVLGLSVGVLTASAAALMGLVAPPNRQGASFGLMQSANSLGFGLGPLFGGVIANLLGLRAPFLVEGVLFLLLGALALRGKRAARGAT
ncbi:MAG: MFS transporter [Chloroflexi bacterium]|nr:MFS transporter [Chloroflexota bacterium]